MCDTLVTVTESGVLFAKNSDRDVNEAQVVRHYPAAGHAPGAALRCTWASIPQVAHTHAVLLSQPWWMWGAEMGANEHGVVIGNEAVFTRRAGDRGAGALLGMDLLRLALERGADRHEAVQVLVSLLEAHGQGGSCSHEHPRFSYDNSFLVADPGGAVVVETAGRRWATEEVARARSISNGLTIPGFAERHADPVRGRVASCAVRRERTTRSAAAAREPGDLMAALRDHGPSGLPRWSPVNGALSAPCAHAGGLVTSTQTTASWVADLRPDAPAGGRHWVTATSAPCTGVFKPVTVAPEGLSGMTSDPRGEPGAPATNRFDPAYLWWRHELFHRLALRDPRRAWTVIAPERDALERDWLDAPPPAVEAVRTAQACTARWGSELLGQRDTRPVWVRRQWARWDREAGLEGVRVAG